MAAKRPRPKYRSGLERSVANIMESRGMEPRHEALTLFYTKPAKKCRYLVDFITDKDKSLILEVKGRFVAADRQKMLLVKEQHPHKRIVMLFGRAKNTISKKSKTTYIDWCDKNGIIWLDIEDFEENPELLFTKTKSGTLKTPARKKSTRSSK
jgi:hypothetical protein